MSTCEPNVTKTDKKTADQLPSTVTQRVTTVDAIGLNPTLRVKLDM